MGDNHRTRVWRNGELEREDFPASEVSDYLEQPDTLVWLDLAPPDPDHFTLIADELGLDALAVEDALSAQERAKVDRYPGHLFVNVYTVRLHSAGKGLATSYISAFVTERALVTVRESEDDFDIEDLVRRWDTSADLAKHGVSYLLHGLIDQVVDGHFDAVQRLDNSIEELEDGLFAEDGGGRDMQRRIFQVRKDLVNLRRVVLPMREVVNTLMRRDLHIIQPEMIPYYQDVYDHSLRATEWTESLRDLVTTILDTRLSLQDIRLNTVMKQVTSWAAIIAVPTAVTGFYGMNVPYPGFGAHWGFAVSVVVLVIGAAALYTVFKVKDWL
jgi:magnesium transporter